MAGIRTEPLPREQPLTWEPFVPDAQEIEFLDRRGPRDDRSFHDVLSNRRSALCGPVKWSDIADLLWHAAAHKGFADKGRAGLPIAWSASPSSGGLQSIGIVCIPDDGSPVKLYDPTKHAFIVLPSDSRAICARNSAAVAAVLGSVRGCTLRMVGDWSKLSAAYENAETLLYRDAGCLTATLCLCAEWLDLCACPLGFLGQDMLPLIGFPSDRFHAAGGVQITKKRS